MAAALIILGPERLPGAVSWAMGSIRKVRDYATGASSQLQDELGTDFEDIRKPLSQLNELRQMSPKSIVTKHLFDGDSSTIDDLSTSVRDSLDISRVQPRQSAPQVDMRKPAAPEPQAPRKADVTDWDAT
ncbi:sec-independent protein translocase protein TatB [Gordonia hydrophobica]|nr:sec-independent protein translocase protein TatB [Gordonia hydrophobica]